ncbi:MAG: DnaB-like helicase C-terminal domain-containing protein, partial [Acetatifactor sp.]|nr:DnaB-like helicase C-terminal domain-containing protein [Acetatifactor sp.]
MTDSVNGAKVAVLCDNNKAPYEEIACLYENQIEFNYLPAAVLKKAMHEQAAPDGTMTDKAPADREASYRISDGNTALVKDGRLCIAGYEYSVILNTLGESYEKLLPAGVRTVHTGEELVGDHSLKSGLTLKEHCETVRLNTLTKDGTTMYLLGNEGDTLVRTEVSVDSDTEVILFDLWKGEAYSLGKTAFELNLAHYMAFKKNLTVALFSLEMSKEQLVNRMFSLESNVDAQKLRTGQLNDQEWERLIESAGTIGKSKLIIDDTPGISISELRSKCRKYKLEHDLSIVMID